MRNLGTATDVHFVGPAMRIPQNTPLALQSPRVGEGHTTRRLRWTRAPSDIFRRPGLRRARGAALASPPGIPGPGDLASVITTLRLERWLQLFTVCPPNPPADNGHASRPASSAAPIVETETVTTVVAQSKESVDAARLRYVSDNDPGLSRRRRGTGFQYLSPPSAPSATRRSSNGSPPSSSPRLDRRLDLRRSQRPHPGHRPRRPPPQAVPLPPLLATGPRRRQVRTDDRLRRGPPADPRTGQQRPRPTWPPPASGSWPPSSAFWRQRSSASERGVRRQQQVVRPDNAPQPPRRRHRHPDRPRVPR